MKLLLWVLIGSILVDVLGAITGANGLSNLGCMTFLAFAVLSPFVYNNQKRVKQHQQPYQQRQQPYQQRQAPIDQRTYLNQQQVFINQQQAYLAHQAYLEQQQIYLGQKANSGQLEAYLNQQGQLEVLQQLLNQQQAYLDQPEPEQQGYREQILDEIVEQYELYRQQKPGASRYIPDATRLEVLERDNYQCVQCGSTQYLELDHIIPLSRGGGSQPNNLQVLCRSCNARKGAS